MTRLALVRVPDGAPSPAGLIGWYTVRPPRRYAVVVDLGAWTAWVKEHEPAALSDCGHVAHDFESRVRRMVATSGTWTCTHCASECAPDGMEARTDSAARIHVTTADGITWESPLDVTEGIPA